MDQNGHFSQFCPFFEMQWGLIFFYFTYSMPVGQKLLIEKIIENIFFMKINIFGIFWPKTLIQRAWYRTLLSKMALAGSNIGVRQKYKKPFLSEITHRKRFFHENWYFWHFWAKNWKNGPCAKVGFFQFCPFFLSNQKV